MLLPDGIFHVARPGLGEEQLDATYDYIAGNPAKSGLVDDGRPWPWLWFAFTGSGTG